MIRNFLIVAGGIGTRMGHELPKQFIPLFNRPILLRTLEQVYLLAPAANIILVLPPHQTENWTQICQASGCSIPHQVIPGGAERFHSVKNGLSLIIDKQGLTAVHDGVRPFFSGGLISRLAEGASRFGNAIPAIPVTDSLRSVSVQGNQPVPRDEIFIIQTPQVFQTSLLLKAYNEEYSPDFTDDASVLEHMGEKIYLVDGEPENIKITKPLDLVYAEALLRNGLS